MSEDVEVKACPVCKAPMEQVLQDYIVDRDGQEMVVEDVPIWVCEQCGYDEVEEEVVDAIEDMLAHMDTVLADEEE